MSTTWKCDDCRDKGCETCWERPDMKAMVDAYIAECQAVTREVEEGYAIAVYLNENRKHGKPGKWTLYFIGEGTGGNMTRLVSGHSMGLALLLSTWEEAVEFSQTLSTDGPFRIVHVRRFPNPTPVFFSHTPPDALDALADI